MAEALLWIWLGILIVSIIVEVATTELKSFWFAFGALAALIVNLIDEDAYFSQIFSFIIVTLASLIFIRPLIRTHLQDLKLDEYGDTLINKEVLVIKKIDKDNPGLVKVDGFTFNAFCFEDEFVEGEKAKIKIIKNKKLYVKKNN